MENKSSKSIQILLLIILILLAVIVFILFKKDQPTQDPYIIQKTHNVQVDNSTGLENQEKTVNDSAATSLSKTIPVLQQVQEIQKYSFKPLTTTYIRGQSWPPVVSVAQGVYSCMPNVGQNDEVVERIIGTKTYCVKIHTEGAAGSTFREYTYRTGSTQVTFTLKFTGSCSNYDEPQNTACETEQANFSADKLVLNAQTNY
jgi:hypothetical protein